MSLQYIPEEANDQTYGDSVMNEAPENTSVPKVTVDNSRTQINKSNS